MSISVEGPGWAQFFELSRVPRARFAAASWLALLVLMGAFYLATDVLNPDASSADILQPPLVTGVMGTDQLGRDVFAQVVAGAWTSLSVGVVSVTVAMLAGTVLGAIAALWPRVIGEIISRIADILLAFPAIILALLLGYMMGTGYLSVVVAIAVVLMPQFIRLVRTRLQIELDSGYVLAERVAGASRWHIMVRHVAPNVLAPVLGFAVLEVSDAILFEAALSFLGVGIQPPTASWGNMLLDAQGTLFAGAWWMSVFPGIALLLTILATITLVDSGEASTVARKRGNS